MDQASFFTRESMATFAGATAMTFFTANAIQRAFNINPTIIAFFLAQIIVLMGVFYMAHASWIDYFLGFVNGCLVFSSAAGATQGAGAFKDGNFSLQSSQRERKFLSQWF